MIAPAFTTKESFFHLMMAMSGLKAKHDWPKPAPKAWIAEHAKFDRWMHNPKFGWSTAPMWSRRLRQLVLSEHPAPPSTIPDVPGPVQRSRWTSPPYAGRGVHVAWGFANGFGAGNWTPWQFAEMIAKTAIPHKWATLEGFPATPGGIDNTPFHIPLRAALTAAGLKYGIWERSDLMTFNSIAAMVDAVRPDFYLADIESFPIADKSIPKLFAQRYPDLPRAVFIAGMPPAEYLVDWVENDWDCMTQAYTGPDARQTAGSMDSDAKWRGFPVNAIGHFSFPCLEIRADQSKGLREQLGDVVQFGTNWSGYNAENYNGDDWAV